MVVTWVDGSVSGIPGRLVVGWEKRSDVRRLALGITITVTYRLGFVF